ncbi:MAG: hypothetical protein ACKO26_19430 [Planctomycetota bacterium]
MPGPEPITESGPDVFLVVGPEERQTDPESIWHRRLMSAWLPHVRRLGLVVVLDRPESRLAFHVHQARLAGKKPVCVSFLPLSRVYPVNGTRTVVATACDHVSAPDWPVGGDPRRRWSRTAPLVDLLLTPVPATEEAFRDAGFQGRVWVIPGPADEPAPGSGVEAEFVEIPFGRPSPQSLEPAWQESDAGARGTSSLLWFALRRGYYRLARPLIPARFHHSMLRGFKQLKSLIRNSASFRAGAFPVDLEGVEVILARLDPIADPHGAFECLLAYRRAMGEQAGRMLVVEASGSLADSVRAMKEMAGRMPACAARLGVTRPGALADAKFAKAISWAVAPGSDRASSEWVQLRLGQGIPVMAPGKGMSLPLGAAWPGIPLECGRVPYALPDDPERMECLLATKARFDELERAFMRAAAVRLGTKGHSHLRDMAILASDSGTRFAAGLIESALATGSQRTSLRSVA